MNLKSAFIGLKTAIVGVFVLGATVASGQENYGQWAQYKNVTINTSSGGANVTANVANYPLLVRLTPGNFPALTTPSTKRSIRFARGPVQLKYYVQDWDSTGSEGALVWVLVDTVFANSSAQTIQMLWGNASAGDSSNSTRVFTRSNGFVGVWHMGVPDGDRTIPRVNSVEPGVNNAVHHSRLDNVMGAITRPGIIGLADTLRGNGSSTTTAGSVNLGDHFSYGPLPTGTFPAGVATLSIWVMPHANPNGSSWRQFINAGSSGGALGSASGWNNIWIGRANVEATLGGSMQTGLTNNANVTAANQITYGEWQHVGSIATGGSTLTIWRNGLQVASGATGILRDTIRSASYIGRAPWNGDSTFKGLVDEARVANVARSASWMKLEYETQRSGSSTLALSGNLSVPSGPPAGLSYSAPTAVYGRNVAIVANNPGSSGGAVDLYTVSPALPAGLSLNASTGVISGIPTEISPPTNYTVAAANILGSTTTQINLSVAGVNYPSNPAIYTLSTPVPANTPSATHFTPTGYSGTLPPGLTLNPTTGAITGTPSTATDAFTQYTITATNGPVSTTIALSIKVQSERYSQWANYLPITINTSAGGGGANVTGAVTQYPMLVRLTTGNFSALTTPGTKKSLRFARAGVNLPYYVQEWDSVGSAGALVWVTVDSIYGNNASQKIQMYWGNASAADSSSGSKTFARSNGFVAAYHMGGPSASPRENVVEPGVNNALYVPLDPFEPSIPGVVGMADTLRGQGTSVPTGTAAGDYFSLGTLPVGTFPGGQVSLSTWVTRGSGFIAGNWSHLIALSNTVGGSGVNNMVIGKSDANISSLFAGIQNGSAGADVLGNTPSAPLTAGAWHHIGMAGNNGTLTVFYNGTARATSTAAQTAQNVERTFNHIGRAPYNDRTWQGIVDEVRIANVARSADWMKLEYETQRTGATGVTVGTGTTVPSAAPQNLSYASPVRYGKGTVIPPNTPTVTGTVDLYTIAPALPAGLSLDPATGVISGTPAGITPPTNYTVTAFNINGFATATINLATVDFSYAVNPATYTKGTTISTNAAIPSAGWTPNSFSGDLPAGLTLNPTTGAITGSPSIATDVFTDYPITATNGTVTFTDTLRIRILENFVSDWGARKVLTVNASSLGLSGAVTNFPMLVRLDSNDADVFNFAGSGGASLRFTTANGITRLPHETAFWDAAARVAEVWVLLDNVPATGSVNFNMYYNKADAPNRSSSSGVFQTSNGFVGVYHLNEATATTNAADATSNNFALTQNNSLALVTPANAVMGGARNFAGGNNSETNANSDYFARATATPLMNPTSAVTLSTWYRAGSTAANRRIMQKTTTDGNLRLSFASTTTLTFAVAGGSGAATVTGTLPTPTTATWHHLQAVADSAALRIYFNGVLATSAARSGAISTGTTGTGNNAFNIGRKPATTTAGEYFQGDMDEFRFSNVSRSADWARLDYETQKPGQMVLTGAGTPGLPQFAPSALSYSSNPAVYGVNIPITANVATLTGVADSFTVSPLLPAGLVLNKGTGVITGTPSAPSAAAPFTVTATNSVGNTQAVVNITVLAAPTGLSYGTDTAVAFVGQTIEPVVPAVTGSQLKFTVTPSLPAGLSLDSLTGVVSGTPTTPTAAQNHAFSATNVAGVSRDTVNLRVLALPTLNSQPIAIKIIAGANASFAVVATGGIAPLSYQWRKGTSPLADGGNISGALSDTLRITGAMVTDSGSYNVVVTNSGGVGSVTSASAQLTVNPLPVINTQPHDTLVAAGAGASFAVSASGGVGPLTYQWFKGASPLVNGGSISGATSATLSLSAAAVPDTGLYSVTVSNADSVGSVTSAEAHLAVNPLPVIDTPPHDSTIIVGGAASFTVAASGGVGPLTYQWRKGTTNLVNGGSISGATSATLSLSGAALTDSGLYNVVVTNAGGVGLVTSANAHLAVNPLPVIASQPQDTAVGAGSPAHFTVSVTGGVAPLVYQWRKGTTPLADGGSVSGAATATLSLSAPVVADSGLYNVVVTNAGGVGSVTSADAHLTVNPLPVIDTQPKDTLVLQAATAGFTVAASGGVGPLTYQWRKGGVPLVNGGNIAGATGTTLTVSNVSSSDAGSYTVVVTNGDGIGFVVSSIAILGIEGLPTITSNPASLTVAAGGNVKLGVAASEGNPPLTYQWRKGGVPLVNGGNITGALTDTLRITGALVTDSGSYTVVVTNTGDPGSVTSAAAQLTVNPLPVVAAQPADTTAVLGGSAGFAVSVTGGVAPLSYQWRKGGTPLVNGAGIAGATSDTLKLSGAVLSDTGSYDVVATNLGGVGAVTSASRVLRVNVPPVVTTPPVNKTVAAGASAGFKVAVSTAGLGGSAGALSYQWRKGTTNLVNGTGVAGATSDTLTLSGVAVSDTSSAYNVVVTRTVSSTTTQTISASATLSVNAVPVIGTPPAARTIVAGGQGGFRVVASVQGGGVLSYQWRKGTTALVNGANVSGATSDTLTLSGVVLADTGAYNAVVTSTLNGVTASATSATSGSAALSVNAVPNITTSPVNTTVAAGGNTTLTVVVSTAGLGSSAGLLGYQWRKNGADLANGGTVSGALSATLTFTGAAPSDLGNYDVVVTRTLGGTTTQATSGSATLTVNTPASITNQPLAATTVVGGNTFNLSVVAEAPTGVLSYVWRRNGTAISGATAATYSKTNAALADTGTYTVVVTRTLNGTTSTVTSNNAVVSVNMAPVITTQPVNTTVTAGSNASLTVVVGTTGLGSMAGTLSYQWQKNGANLVNGGAVGGATGATLTITSAVASDLGNYGVIVTRTLNSVLSSTTSNNAVLSVNTAPVITTPPLTQTVVGGGNANFSVAATGGSGVLSYQWRKNGTPLTGATSVNYSVVGASLADTGVFSVVVTHTLNATTTSTTSGNATLSVNMAPSITAQPGHQIVATGGTATFTVAVAAGVGSSAGVLSYQWRKGTVNLSDGGNVTGATGPTLTLTGTLATDTGRSISGSGYSVVVTRTLNATTAATTSGIADLTTPVGILPGSFVFRVSGAERPYTFQLPAGATEVERVTMSISDIWGRTLWTKSIYPSRDEAAREVTWNGRTQGGRTAAAGMYVMRIAVKNGETTTHYVQKAVTLKPAR